MEVAAGNGSPGRPRPDSMTLAVAASRLLCLLGHHLPDAGMVWHGGYGFAHCRRCRRAIVRSLLSDWVVPGPGLRIVWPTGADALAAGTGQISSRPPRRGAATPPISGPGEHADASPAPQTNPASHGPASDNAGRRDAEAAAVPVIVRGRPVAASQSDAVAPVSSDTARSSVVSALPQPIDLLGPHFMGDKGAPPGPRDGMAVFEFDDMGASEDGGSTDPVSAKRAG